MSPVQILKWLTILLAVVGVLGLVAYAIFVTRASGDAATERVSTQTVVEEMRGIGRLELAHYRMKVTQAHEADIPLRLGMIVLPRKSKVLVIASGEAIGCVDFAKLDSNSISTTDSSVSLRLPPPEVCTHRVIMSESEVYSAEFSMLMFNDDVAKASLVKAAFKNAESAVLDAALKQGILAETDRQAELFLKPLLSKFGFRRVQITHTAPAADR